VLFSICNPDVLHDLFLRAGLDAVQVVPIEVDTLFADFEDFWLPFLGGRGPAGAYVRSLTEDERSILRESVYAVLPFLENGQIPLAARAWAVRGIKRES